MITTIEETPSFDDLTLEDVLAVDSKANMLQAAHIWGLDLPKSWRKDNIARCMAHALKTEPQYVWDHLGQEAIDQIDELVRAGKGKSITVTHDDEEFSRLQESLLVICSEPNDGQCRLYMLDEVYDIFKELIDGHEEMLTNMTEQFAEDKKRELEEAVKASKENRPLDFLPTLTSNPREWPDDVSHVVCKMIRPNVIETTLRLSADRYLVCYFLKQDGYIHATCNWGDILDFVWNGVETPWPGADYLVPKRPFRKKYPAIADAFGQKCDDSGKCLPVPYITTISWEGQPEAWFLNYKIYGLNFADFAMYGPIVDKEYGTAICAIRDLSIKFFKEIMRSDAKSPKAKMKEFFGFDTLPVDDSLTPFGLMPLPIKEGESDGSSLPDVDMDKLTDFIKQIKAKGGM